MVGVRNPGFILLATPDARPRPLILVMPGVAGVRTPDVIFLATPTSGKSGPELYLHCSGGRCDTPLRPVGVAKKDDIGVRTPATPGHLWDLRGGRPETSVAPV